MANGPFTVRSSTPHSLTWEVASDSGVARTLADIISDCAEGPLRTWLQTQLGAVWGSGANDPRTKDVLRVYIAQLSGAPTVGVSFGQSGGNNQIEVEPGADVAYSAYITLQFEHSANR